MNRKPTKDISHDTPTAAVRIWEESVVIPTYPPPAPDPNPMFFEKRVNQGASGRVYPNPFTDRVNHETKVDQVYEAVFLENEFLQLTVLPQFGGRIHAALDKTNGYDFIYRQHVVKPGLIGLFGSWLSGGMEFNWPIHHRPSTFMPVEYTIEHAADGSATLWLSEHEPMNRMKGMVGICLYPGRAFFEFKVQLYNRTALPQPFLWWINCAVHVNDQYQLIFPPDVESVTFHSRAAMTSYPVARNLYMGADWRAGVDISWPGRVGITTSYFATPSRYEFFGGYDHGKRGGIIHVANHHVSPGKKCFVWGTGEFGSAWQAALTDADGPYIELMASAYSDNQPDFSWLQPGETKLFRQYWYPFQEIGVVKNATRRVAVNLEDGFVGVCATETIPGARIDVTLGDHLLLSDQADLVPGRPFVSRDPRLAQAAEKGATLSVTDAAGNVLVSYRQEPRKDLPLPPVAKPPKMPHQIDSLEELYITGLHVEQYLHFSVDPAPYWERALQIAPGDARNANALGRLRLRRGDFSGAEELFRRAIQTLTQYNFNPLDGEPHYNLGLALAFQGRTDDAYDAFYKAIWSYAWQAPGYFALARIDLLRGESESAVEHLDRSLATNAYHSEARCLKAAALRLLGRAEEAARVAQEALDFDPLDHWACNELALAQRDLGQSDAAVARLAAMMRGTDQNHLDLAFDYAGAGLHAEAIEVLTRVADSGSTNPMVYYTLAFCAGELGQADAARESRRRAAAQPPDWCFPVRLEELAVLEAARAANPDDARAAYYLGNLLYDKKQYQRAIAAWEIAARLEPAFAIPWRNLSIACYNVRRDPEAARVCYDQALASNPRDARLLMEHDQLLQRLGASSSDRVVLLAKHADLVDQRDDLSVEYASLYNRMDLPEKALEALLSHRFHAWEGGEGQAAGQYALAHLLLGCAALERGEAQAAFQYFGKAQDTPASLGVGRTSTQMDGQVWFHIAVACEALGQADAAKEYYAKVLQAETREALTQPFSPLTYYAAMAMRKMGDEAGSIAMLRALLDHATQRLTAEEEIAFLTSRPVAVVFDEDPKVVRAMHYEPLVALAQAGLEGRAVLAGGK